MSRRRPRRRPGQEATLGQYLRARRSTIQFFLFFLCGLTVGSLYAAMDGSSTMVLLSILVNSVKIQQTSSFLRIFFQSVTQAFGILVYLYFSAYCMKGKWLIYLTPLVFGLSVGTVVTSVLYRFLLTGVPYVVLCVFIPKFLELLLLLVLCNNCLRISAGIGTGAPIRGEIFWVFAILLGIFALFESAMIFRFCHLLSLGI